MSELPFDLPPEVKKQIKAQQEKQLKAEAAKKSPEELTPQEEAEKALLGDGSAAQENPFEVATLADAMKLREQIRGEIRFETRAKVTVSPETQEERSRNLHELNEKIRSFQEVEVGALTTGIEDLSELRDIAAGETSGDTEQQAEAAKLGGKEGIETKIYRLKKDQIRLQKEITKDDIVAAREAANLDEEDTVRFEIAKTEANLEDAQEQVDPARVNQLRGELTQLEKIADLEKTLANFATEERNLETARKKIEKEAKDAAIEDLTEFAVAEDDTQRLTVEGGQHREAPPAAASAEAQEAAAARATGTETGKQEKRGLRDIIASILKNRRNKPPQQPRT